MVRPKWRREVPDVIEVGAARVDKDEVKKSFLQG